MKGVFPVLAFLFITDKCLSVHECSIGFCDASGSREKEHAGKLKKIFQSPTNKLYCLFLSEALTPFNVINSTLQCEEPMVHCLKRLLEKFLRQLLLRFVKPSAMLHKAAVDVDFEQAYNQKPCSELVLGDAVRDFLADKNSRLRDERKEGFFKAAQQFYITSCRYLKTKLPFKDDLLRNAAVADPEQQTEVTFSSVKYFTERFPAMLPLNASAGELELEFADYQSTDISSCKAERVDATWGNIAKLQEGGERRFTNLPRLMVSILTIPHSSAHCERIFSEVRKNHTDFRNRLSKDTLEALLVNKSRPGNALERKYSQKDYKQLKSAYYQSLQEFKSKK